MTQDFESAIPWNEQTSHSADITPLMTHNGMCPWPQYLVEIKIGKTPTDPALGYLMTGGREQKLKQNSQLTLLFMTTVYGNIFTRQNFVFWPERQFHRGKGLWDPSSKHMARYVLYVILTGKKIAPTNCSLRTFWVFYPFKATSTYSMYLETEQLFCNIGPHSLWCRLYPHT